ncbi:MAG: hypothetical protein J6A77_06640 [Lachnospiraceae bacterium]|nr:hypothetical protein [Lachnospiraceae bacterium]
MIRQFNMSCLRGIRDGKVLYEYDSKNEVIDIKKSAGIWWDKHHKSSIMDVLLMKRTKNKYAGDKYFSFVESYIRLYSGKDEIIFKKKFPDEIDTSDACEFRMWWEDINTSLNQQGYWLFDEG